MTNKTAQDKRSKTRTSKKKKAPNLHCPILEHTRHAVRAGEDYVKAMNKLRLAQAACSKCIAVADCPIRQEFNNQMDAAILAVNQMWGLI